MRDKHSTHHCCVAALWNVDKGHWCEEGDGLGRRAITSWARWLFLPQLEDTRHRLQHPDTILLARLLCASTNYRLLICHHHRHRRSSTT